MAMPLSNLTGPFQTYNQEEPAQLLCYSSQVSPVQGMCVFVTLAVGSRLSGKAMHRRGTRLMGRMQKSRPSIALQYCR